MGSVMAARLSALLPRLAVLTVIWLLATSTITFAAGGRNEDTTPAPVAGPQEPAYMVVPDVREQAYVFAKGILADAGFAWKVEGPVEWPVDPTRPTGVPAASVVPGMIWGSMYERWQ